jgi:hypothetical protein
MMEAPFRFPIQGIEDLERLVTVLAQSPLLVPGSLRLTEGIDLLAQQFAAEGCNAQDLLVHADSAGGITSLFRALWACPLFTRRPRFLRMEAIPAADPTTVLSLRVSVPTVDDRPRWVDVEGSRDRVKLAQLIGLYRALGEQAGLELYEV